MAAPVRTAPQPAVVATTAVRKRPRWSSGHIVMVVAGLLGVVLTLLALRAADARVTVSVASSDFSAGTRVSTASFVTKRVRLEPTLRASMVTPSDVASYQGATLLTPVKAGEPFPKAALVKGATRDGRRSLSMPIAPERAVGGKLRNGDRVDVYTTGTKGGLVTTNVEVLDVFRSDVGPLAAKDSLTVVLAVTSDQANRIAPIVGSNDVVLVQATGAAAATTSTTMNAALTPIAPGVAPGG